MPSPPPPASRPCRLCLRQVVSTLVLWFSESFTADHHRHWRHRVLVGLITAQLITCALRLALSVDGPLDFQFLSYNQTNGTNATGGWLPGGSTGRRLAGRSSAGSGGRSATFSTTSETALDGSEMPTDWLHEAYKAVIAVQALLYSVNLLRLCYVWRRIGTIITSVRSVIATTSQVLMCFLLLVGGVSLAFELLLRPSDAGESIFFFWSVEEPDQTDPTDDALTITRWRIPWFAMYGAIDWPGLALSTAGSPVSMVLAPIMLWFYLLLVQITFINLIVAIMTETFISSSGEVRASAAAALSRAVGGGLPDTAPPATASPSTDCLPTGRSSLAHEPHRHEQRHGADGATARAL